MACMIDWFVACLVDNEPKRSVCRCSCRIWSTLQSPWLDDTHTCLENLEQRKKTGEHAARDRNYWECLGTVHKT